MNFTDQLSGKLIVTKHHDVEVVVLHVEQILTVVVAQRYSATVHTPK